MSDGSSEVKAVDLSRGTVQPDGRNQGARFGAYALFRRAAEARRSAAAANDRLDGQGQQRALMVLGDLNDSPEAATSQILNGPGGSEIGTVGADRPDAGDGSRLWNLAPLLPAGEQYSRIYRGHGELIDQIFVSHRLHDRVVSMHSLVERPLPSIHDNPAGHDDAVDSDHAPVVAEFDLGFPWRLHLRGLAVGALSSWISGLLWWPAGGRRCPPAGRGSGLGLGLGLGQEVDLVSGDEGCGSGVGRRCRSSRWWLAQAVR